jgi:serine/threonine protein kinase
MSRALTTPPATEEDDGENAQLYYRATGGCIPVRWAAVEVLTDHRFTEKSDVWSFAITCMEVFTDGELPYVGLRSNDDVYKAVMAGTRMECPLGYPQVMFDQVIDPSWSANAAQRPTFDELQRRLRPLLKRFSDPAQSITKAAHRLGSGLGSNHHDSAADRQDAVLAAYTELEGADGQAMGVLTRFEPSECTPANLAIASGDVQHLGKDGAVPAQASTVVEGQFPLSCTCVIACRLCPVSGYA